jgi:hypothetical protein
VFIDESGIDHGIIKARAWAKKGQVIVGKRSAKHFFKNECHYEFMQQEMCCPMSFPGTCNTEVFNT